MADVPERTEVLSVIRHQVRSDSREQYEAWLREIVPIAAGYPGHRGVNIIKPAGGLSEYVIVLHFDRIDNLRAWLESDVRNDLVKKVRPCLEVAEDIKIETGLEFWFMPPEALQRHAKPYKQFLATLSVIYPLTLIVPWAFRPVFAAVPPLGSLLVANLLINVVIVGLLTWVIMPRYTRLLAKWLFRS
jgi:antibiotic biosynthesis monooxygenase (ABM) superfamily enzyme